MATQTATHYTIIVRLTALPAWLQLPRRQRQQFQQEIIAPVLAKYNQQVQVRWLDAEAFNAACSDIALFETDDLRTYYFLMEELRDTEFFAKPYFRLEDITIGMEDGYLAFEQKF